MCVCVYTGLCLTLPFIFSICHSCVCVCRYKCLQCISLYCVFIYTQVLSMSVVVCVFVCLCLCVCMCADLKGLYYQHLGNKQIENHRVLFCLLIVKALSPRVTGLLTGGMDRLASPKYQLGMWALRILIPCSFSLLSHLFIVVPGDSCESIT